jgi:hypothetical protein
VLVNDEERVARIEALLLRFSQATTRRTLLRSEAKEFAARLGEIRAAFGNPYFYSGENHGRPENADESVAKYSGYRAHEPGLRIALGLIDIDRELSTVREQLRVLGVSSA